MKLSTIISSFGLIVCVSGWSYSGNDGPEYWKDTYSNCGLSNQSPIDLETSTVTTDESLGDIVYTNYDTAPSSDFTVENNGHSAKVSIADSDITISGGGLGGEYILSQFHFHWGDDTSTGGSEHLLDGERYAAEVHFVHYSSQYASLSQAVTQVNGLAVLGFFIEAGSNNENYDTLESKLSDIEYKDDTASMAAVPLQTFLPSSLGSFFRYNGSLTTPSCDESVIWTVYKEKLQMSTSQLEAFRNLKDGLYANASVVENTYRPVQNLNGRTVYDNSAWNNSPRCVISAVTLVVIASISFII